MGSEDLAGAAVRGDGRVFQRGRVWYIACYAPIDGRSKEIKEAVDPNESQARKRLRARLREVLNAQAGVEKFRGPRQEQVTVHEILTNLERDHEIQGRRSLPPRWTPKTGQSWTAENRPVR